MEYGSNATKLQSLQYSRTPLLLFPYPFAFSKSFMNEIRASTDSLGTAL
jgi:hypothetical protein